MSNGEKGITYNFHQREFDIISFTQMQMCQNAFQLSFCHSERSEDYTLTK